MIFFVLIVSFFSLINSSKLKLHSFEPPFKDVDGHGDRYTSFLLLLFLLFFILLDFLLFFRIVGKDWRSSGHTGLF